MTSARTCILALAATLLAVAMIAGQDRQSSDTQNTAKPKPETKPVLVDALRVNTDAAARSVAKGEASKQAADKAKNTPDNAVMEFHATDPSLASPAGTGAPAKKSKQDPLKDMHGNVYGSTDPKNPGTHNAGAAAGATSKSGNTSVYVETETSRATPPH